MYLQKNTILHGGKYKIIEIIGQGGFGFVYKVNHQLLNKVVCVKEFFYSDFCVRKPNSLEVTLLSTSGSRIQFVKTLKSKFIKEAQRLATFQHPNIVQVMDVFEENSTAYYVMEFLEGGSLEKQLKNGPFKEEQTLSIMLPILGGLKAIHDSELLHLDLKPMNIMFRKDGKPVIIDFGLSKFLDTSNNHATTAPIGISKGYAPIEQYGGNISDCSEATDIYAICATMYHMLTGNVPPEPIQILKEGLKSLSEFGIDVSVRIDNAIRKGLSLHKADRYASVMQLIECLYETPKNTKNSIDKSLPLTKGGDIINNKLYSYTTIGNYNEGLAIVEHYGKFGYIGKSGVEVIPCRYEGATNFCDGFARVKVDGKFGYIDKKGKEVIPIKYSSAAPNFSEGRAFVQKNGKYGFINIKGEEIINCRFESAFNFSEGLAKVKLNGKFGYISYDGRDIIPYKYSMAYRFSDGYALVFKDIEPMFINKYGLDALQIHPKYAKARPFSNGFAIVGKSNLTVNNGDAESEHLWGFINNKGVEIVPCKYNDVENFDNFGLAPVMRIDKDNDQQKWGLINQNGKEVVPLNYYKLTDTYKTLQKNIKLWHLKNGTVSVFDKNNNLLFSFKVDFGNVSLKSFSVSIYGGKVGYMDETGAWVIPPKFNKGWEFIDDRALVKLNEDFCVIDNQGRIIMK